MADTIQLEIVTPERHLVDAHVDSVQIPGLDGELGILPGHSPLISQLMPAGLLTYVQGGVTRQVVLAEGFVEVLPNHVRILAEVAEAPEEIDVDRAIRARERSEKRVLQSQTDPTIDGERAARAYARAATRIGVAKKK